MTDKWAPQFSTDQVEESLYFLAWHDTMERLLILLYEVRHLQENIIFTLRTPKLYRVLRFEEFYLWPSLNHEGNDQHADGKYRYFSTFLRSKDFAKQHVIPFFNPTIETEERNWDDASSDAKALYEDIMGFVRKQWCSGKWSHAKQEYYLILSASQELKRHIVADRARLLYVGQMALQQVETVSGKATRKEHRHKSCNELMLLRSAISGKIRDYIIRLGDFQGYFSKTQDLGLQDHPRPSMERRREQRFYTAYLSRRSIYLYKELHSFLYDCGSFSGKPPDSRNLSAKVGKPNLGTEESLNIPVILHRWHHDFSSQSETLFDSMDGRKPGVSHFINSSYFMPERPDLQTLMAHEVAHAVLRDHFTNLSFQDLTNGGSFRGLLRDIGHVLSLFQYSDRVETPTSVLHEIAADLLAGAIRGPSYLYALYLDFIGTDLDVIFRFGPFHHGVELDNLYQLEGTCGQFDQIRLWFIRLQILSAWVLAITPKEQEAGQMDLAHDLSRKMALGVTRIANRLVEQLDALTPNHSKNLQYWLQLGKRLQVAVEISRAAQDVRMHQDELLKKDKENTLRPFLRSLDAFARGGLYKWFYAILDRFPNPDGPEDAIDSLIQSQLVPRDEVNVLLRHCCLAQVDKQIDQDALMKKLQAFSAPDGLFRTHTDVPWQYGLIMGHQLLARLRPMDGARQHIAVWDRALFRFMPPLRHGHQLALDFHYHQSEPPSIILEEICRVLMVPSSWTTEMSSQAKLIFCGEPSTSNPLRGTLEMAFQCALFKWLRGGYTPSIEVQYDRIVRREDLPAYDEKWKESDEKLPPALVLLGKPRNQGQAKIGKEVYPLMRKKISQFLQICTTYLGSSPKANLPLAGKCKALRGLIDYVTIAQQKTPLPENLSKQAEFYGRIFRSVLCCEGPERCATPPREACCGGILPSHLLGKVSTGSIYHALSQPPGAANSLGGFLGSFSHPRIAPEQPPISGNPSTKAPHQDEWFKYRYYHTTGLIGRYDFMLAAPACNDNVFKMPRFEPIPEAGKEPASPQQRYHEHLLPFFVRWELGIPVRLSSRRWQDAFPLEKQSVAPEKVIIAYMSLGLAHGSSRLDFMYRILESIQKLGTPCPATLDCAAPKDITELARFFGDQDVAFLTDGWEDVLFVFRDTPDMLWRVFAIQKALYEDFQVERTELNITCKGMDYMLHAPSQVRLRTMVRLADEGTLAQSDAEFAKTVYENSNGNFTITPGEGDPSVPYDCKDFFTRTVDMCRTPGRMDYSFRVGELSNKNLYKDIRNFCAEHKITLNPAYPILHSYIRQLFRDTRLDRLQTNFGYKELNEETPPTPFKLFDGK